MKHHHSDIEFVIPGFGDLKKQPAILNALRNYAKEMGFSDKEMNDIRDRRVLLMVYKAMMLDHIIHNEMLNK